MSKKAPKKIRNAAADALLKQQIEWADALHQYETTDVADKREVQRKLREEKECD